MDVDGEGGCVEGDVPLGREAVHRVDEAALRH